MANERRSFSTAAAPTTLATGINNAVTSLTVQDGSTYVDGTSGNSVLTIDRGKSNEERILYTSRVGNTFTGLTRGYNGTAAQDHTAGAIVEHTSTQQDFDEANALVAGAHGWATWTPTVTGHGSLTATPLAHVSNHARWVQTGKIVAVSFSQLYTFAGTGDGIDVTLPLTSANNRVAAAAEIQGAIARATSGDVGTIMSLYRYDGANVAAGNFHVAFHCFYEVA